MGIDNWEWTWGSEYKRAQMLRDALSDANAQRAATNRRLSSKISELQGTLDTKLNALSTAFDAFVELGDIREQLLELPDWSHTRRAVQASLTTVMEGGDPAPLDPDEHDHWLADAMNAVLALVAGQEADEYERRALSKSDQAPLFIITTLLSLGAGERSDGRLAAVFEGVTELDGDHLPLLRGAAAGFVPVSELAGIGRQLAPALDSPGEWRLWMGLRDDSPSQHDRVTHFLDTGTRTTQRGLRNDVGPQWTYDDVADRLATRAGVLSRSGSKEEAQLRTRAHHLRQRIEDPTGKQVRPAAGALSAVEAVQEILRHPDTPDESRVAIASWLHAPLAALVEGWQGVGAGPRPSETMTMSWGPLHHRVRVEVTSDGPDQKAQRRAEQQIQALEPEKGNVNALFGGAAASAAVGLLTMLAGGGWIALGVILVVVAGVLAVMGILRKRNVAVLESAKGEAVRQLRDRTRVLSDELREKQAAQEEDFRQTAKSLDALLARLRGHGAPPPAVPEPAGLPDFLLTDDADRDADSDAGEAASRPIG